MQRMGADDPTTDRSGSGRPRLDSGAVTTVQGPAGADVSEGDLTPLPPPRVQASMIAEFSAERIESFYTRASAPPRIEDMTPIEARMGGGVTGEGRSPTGPLPLPPLPLPERGPLGLWRLGTEHTFDTRELIDPIDARWTLAVWIIGALLGLSGFAVSIWAIVTHARSGPVPLWAPVVAVSTALLLPILRLAEAVMVARIHRGGIEAGPEQLRPLWDRYLEVGARLGLERLPPLFVYDTVPGEGWLVRLAQASVIVLPTEALRSPEAMLLGLGRALGAHRVGHGDALDTTLTLPVRLAFALVAPLGWLGLAVSPLQALRAARSFTSDRAACVGVGELGLVIEEILGQGGMGLVTHLDLKALAAQRERRSRVGRLWLALGSPGAAVSERIFRLHRFALPYLTRD